MRGGWNLGKSVVRQVCQEGRGLGPGSETHYGDSFQQLQPRSREQRTGKGEGLMTNLQMGRGRWDPPKKRVSRGRMSKCYDL